MRLIEQGADSSRAFSAIYTNDLKSWEFGKETPQIWPGEADAIAAKLKKFSDAGGDKFGGCPTTPKTNFSSCFGI